MVNPIYNYLDFHWIPAYQPHSISILEDVRFFKIRLVACETEFMNWFYGLEPIE